MSTKTIPAKDLTHEPPRSARVRVGGYVILGRTIDKCRALLAGKIGEYHFDCPLDNQLFSFKGVTGDDFKKEVARGASDEQLVEWVDRNGVPKAPEEIKQWGNALTTYSLISDPEKKEFFIQECRKIGVDPYKSSLFDWLEADDKVSFKK
jgi:hypothetical protein